MKVRTFALTYPQLMNQAIRLKLADQDLIRLRKAYELSERWFDGLYRGQHVPFICHLVRTASILLEEKLSVEVVLAGLVHAVYAVGCFKDFRHGKATSDHRVEVRDELGEEVEQLIFDYDKFPWYRKDCIESHMDQFANYNLREKNLLLMRLANELEDYLDYGMAYRAVFPYREKVVAYGNLAIELANRLGHSQLADELKEVFEINLSSNLPKVVLMNQSSSFQLPALKWLKKSYFEKLRYKTEQFLAGLSGSKNQIEGIAK